MGITVDLWRCRIVCFSQKHTRLSKSTGGKIHLSMFQSSISLSLRIALFALLIVQGIECNPGPTQGEKGGKLSTIPDRSTRSRTGSNIAARGEERRNSITRTVSTSEHRALNVSTPSTLSPVRQNSDQPSINDYFANRIDNQDSCASSEKLSNVRTQLHSEADTTVMPILIDIQRSIKVLDSKFDKMEKTLSDLKTENETLKQENAELSKKVDDLNSKVEHLEAQSRRENLKFFNIPESKGETWEQSEDKVRQYLKDNLDIDESKISIERAHRLPSSSKPRPIIVKFSLFKDKDRILQKFKSMKRHERENGEVSSKISVGEDFPLRISKARYNLTPFMITAIKDGKKAYLQYDKLVIDGKRHVFDYDKGEPVQMDR